MIEAETRHVLRLIPALKHAHPLVQHIGMVERPERYMVLPARHYLVAVQRVELYCHDRVH